MDLQGLLLCPKLQASALYYKMKLGVHNFTIYDVASHDATNYIWHECEAGLSASEFASCIVHFLEAHSTFTEFILWSDGCGYQNRNLILSNALLKFATEQKKCVTQKYLQRGHTQMECDCSQRDREKTLRERYSCSSWICGSDQRSSFTSWTIQCEVCWSHLFQGLQQSKFVQVNPTW